MADFRLVVFFAVAVAEGEETVEDDDKDEDVGKAINNASLVAHKICFKISFW